MHVVICGGRDYPPFGEAEWAFLEALHTATPFAEVLTGGAPGADRWADLWAQQRGLDRLIFPANWSRYDTSAGPLRNRRMLGYLERFRSSDIAVIAFPGGKGTRNCCAIAEAKEIRVIRYVPPQEVPHGQ